MFTNKLQPRKKVWGGGGGMAQPNIRPNKPDSVLLLLSTKLF